MALMAYLFLQDQRLQGAKRGKKEGQRATSATQLPQHQAHAA
jgi:hypothetical protein